MHSTKGSKTVQRHSLGQKKQQSSSHKNSLKPSLQVKSKQQQQHQSTRTNPQRSIRTIKTRLSSVQPSQTNSFKTKITTNNNNNNNDNNMTTTSLSSPQQYLLNQNKLQFSTSPQNTNLSITARSIPQQHGISTSLSFLTTKPPLLNKTSQSSSLHHNKQSLFYQQRRNASGNTSHDPNLDGEKRVQTGVYDSGDEVDESEELHNKKLVKLGRWGQTPTLASMSSRKGAQSSVLQRYLNLPNKRYRIQQLNRVLALSHKREDELTPDEIEELKTLPTDHEITKADMAEYKLYQEVKQEALKRFRLSEADWNDSVQDLEDDDEVKEAVKEASEPNSGVRVIALDMLHVEDYIERNLDKMEFPRIMKNRRKTNNNDNSDNESNNNTNEDELGDKNDIVDELTPEQLAQAQNLYNQATDPLAHHERPYSYLNEGNSNEEMTLRDHKRMLQKLWGPPVPGAPTNPELLYAPGVKVIFRADEFPIHPRTGNMLPVDYENHHLHNPYDYFSPDTSTVFDPPINPMDDPVDVRRRIAHASMTMEEQLHNVRQSIECPVELHAFDHTLVPILSHRFFVDYISDDDPSKPYSDRHWLYEAMNHPDPHQRFIPNTQDYGDWGEFLLYDITTGPPNLRWRTAGFFLMMFGFGGLMGMEAVMSMNQYFYDLQHPFH